MKQFTIRLLWFVSIFLILVIIGAFTGYKSLNNSAYFKISDKTNYIVLGHSHPECAFNDSLIPGFENFGSSAEAYYYTYLKTKKIIANNKQIKTVFIEFSNSQLTKLMDIYTWGDAIIQERFITYIPLMDYSDFNFIWTKNSKGILDCPPKLFIKSMFRNMYNIAIKKNIKTDKRFGSYQYLVKDKTDTLTNQANNKLNENTNGELTETNITYLTKTIEFCKLNNVKVFLIRSPLHSKYTGYYNEPLLREFLSSEFSSVEFLDFKDFPLKDNEYADLEHLNYKGAKVFSGFFNNILNSGLLNKDNKQQFIYVEILKLSATKPTKKIVLNSHTSKIDALINQDQQSKLR